MAAQHANTSENPQVFLSGQLAVLNKLRYSDLDSPHSDRGKHSNKDIRTGDVNLEIRVLDTIAVALTSGQRGEVVATAFEKGQDHLTLVLAKNDHASAKDRDVADRLVQIINDPETKTAFHVLPDLLRRCKNIPSRVDKMAEAVDIFGSNFDKYFKNYPVSPDGVLIELPNSEYYRDPKYRNVGRPVDIRTMLKTLTKDIQKTAKDYSKNRESAQKFGELAMVADVLMRSAFLNWLCNSKVKQAQKLKRRIAKVCQLFHGLDEVITYVRKDKSFVQCRWVDNIKSPYETEVQLNTQEIISTICKSNRINTNNLKKLWIYETRSIQTRLHAEIRVLLHLSHPSDDREQRPIGCSKRSCMCCNLWFTAYNDTFGCQWLTSGSHGKSYPAWALPGYPHAELPNGKKTVDEIVLERVSQRLIAWLRVVSVDSKLAKEALLSDDHRSSGSEPDEEAQDRRTTWYSGKNTSVP